MKNLITIALIFISANAFSQTPVSTTMQTMAVDSITIPKLDFEQFERINNIEKNLNSFYKKNRTSHKFYFLSVGLGVAGGMIKILTADNNNKTANILSLASGVSGIIGTVIYLDSYKFLKFKPKKKEIRKVTNFE